MSSVGGSVKETFNGIDEAIVIAPPEDDGGFTWTLEAAGYVSDNPKHRGQGVGFYKYTGNKTEVEVPHVIHGHKMTSYYKMFEYTNVSKVIHNNPRIKNMVYMFNRSTAETLDVSEFTTKNVVRMDGMFEFAQAKKLDLRSFDTRSVTSMTVMFYGSYATEIMLNSFDTRRVESMSWMFRKSKAEILDLSTFDLGSLKIYEYMFKGAAARTGLTKDQATADILNATTEKPDELVFTVKP